MTIRPALRADRAFVLGLADRLAAHEMPAWRTAGEIIDGDRRALEAWFDAMPDRDAMLVAELDGHPSGCAYLMTVVDYFTGRAHGHLSVLAVSAEAEGRGVGTALLTASEDWARRRGFDRLTLNTLVNNRRARRLYERRGFAGESIRYVKPL